MRKKGWELNNQLGFNAAEVDVMILSHAHIDHSGRLPKLVKEGFSGKIFSTHATRSLCNILLMDSAMIQERDVEWFNKRLMKKKKKHKGKFKGEKLRSPLYVTEDVAPALNKFVGCPYDTWIRINDEVEFILRDAGHILGSATVTLRIIENGEQKMLGFTGDIGRPNRPIIKDPVQMPKLDYLLTESTYGDRLHGSDPEQADQLLEIIKHTCIEKKGKLIIPAFSVERTQEIVYMLDKMETAGDFPENLPIYVDSPLAVNATMIFASHPECYDKEIHEYLLLDDNPFGFNSLHYNKSVEGSKRLNDIKKPMIIISAAGMMNAGRIKHHLYNNVEDWRTTFLLVGYCSPQTPCAALKSGVSEMRIFGDTKSVKAEVVSMDSFSGHGDRDEMLEFLSNQTDVKRTFIVHGEYESQKAFKSALQQKGFDDIYIPMLGEEVEF